MSALAVNISPHGLGHSMVDAMTKPFNMWAAEPYPPHSRYYPRELSGPSQRLPPPSSLVTARHASNPLISTPTEAASKRGMYQDGYAIISPRHHSFSQSSTLGREPYGIANTTHRGREDVDGPRLSPANSSTASDRSEETTPDPLRLRQLVRDQSSSQLPWLQPPSTYGGNGYAPEPSRPYSRHAPPAGFLPATYGNSNSRSNSTIRPDQQQPQQQRSSHSMSVTPTSQWPSRLLIDSRAPPPPPAAASSSSAPERMRISDLLSSEEPSAAAPPPPPLPQWRQQQQQGITMITKTEAAAAVPPSMGRPMGRPAHASPMPYTPPKQLTVRQQPAAARSCGFGERDRRVIDPPPIVQLRFLPEEEDNDEDDEDNNDDGNEDGDEGNDEGGGAGLENAGATGGSSGSGSGSSSSRRGSRRRTTMSLTKSPSDREVRRCGWIRHPYAVMHCAIWSEAGDKDVSMMPEDYRPQRRLMGTVVSSSFVGLDEHGEEGCFFCFPDLSCRTPGSFRLKFSLVLLDPARSTPGYKTPVSAEVMSAVFTVYNAKDFPGMQASTPLTKRLKEQGCLISIKKGNEKGGSSSRHDRDGGDSDDDDYDDHQHSEMPGRGRKRQRRQ
jgi:hypothetical protein